MEKDKDLDHGLPSGDSVLIDEKERFFRHGWTGLILPRYIFVNRRFRGVVLDPPDFTPGSWIGVLYKANNAHKVSAAFDRSIVDCFA